MDTLILQQSHHRLPSGCQVVSERPLRCADSCVLPRFRKLTFSATESASSKFFLGACMRRITSGSLFSLDSMEFNFDDSLFGNTEKASVINKPPVAYNAKDTPPQWFLHKNISFVEDETDRLQILKHRADFYYWSQSFTDVISCTTEALGAIKRENHPMARDLLELKARSLGRLGRGEEALTAARTLLGLGQSEDQLIAAFNLQLDLCKQLGAADGVLTNVQRLLLLLPSSAALWWQYQQGLEAGGDLVTAALRFASASRARGLLTAASEVVPSPVEDCITKLRNTLPAGILEAVDENITSMESHVSFPVLCQKLTDSECDVNDLFLETFFRAILNAVHVVVEIT